MTRNCIVRFAVKEDIKQLLVVDPWPRDDVWAMKVAAKEVVVLDNDGLIVGLARFSLLWTTVPFLGLICINSKFRGKGYSREMLEFLQNDLREQGYVVLLSSSQTNEPEPQEWHRKMGFKSNGIIENIADDDIGEVVFRKIL